MTDVPLYEPDRIEGVPHPRHAAQVFGQGAAEAAFLDAFTGKRMHHAWLLTGPRGIGKATLAWRLARFLLAQPTGGDGMFETPPPSSLEIAPNHPVAARLEALSEPRFFLMRPTLHPERGTERREITIDVARALKGFLQMTASDGGRRVVLVDTVDLLNTAAANAILKLLEEPPPQTTFLLVSHAPARLLPTIRSRCRTLPCAPLSGPDIAAALKQAGLETDVEPAALTQLSEGSAGEAARLIQEDGPAIYARLVALASSCPDMDRPALIALGQNLFGSAGTARMDVLQRLLDLLMARLARHGSGLPPDAEAARGEAALLERLSPTPSAGRRWAMLQQEVSARLAHGRAVNLDPSSLILDTGLSINDTGRAILGR